MPLPCAKLTSTPWIKIPILSHKPIKKLWIVIIYLFIYHVYTCIIVGGSCNQAPLSPFYFCTWGPIFSTTIDIYIYIYIVKQSYKDHIDTYYIFIFQFFWPNRVLIIGCRGLLMNHPYLINLWMWSGRMLWTVFCNGFVFLRAFLANFSNFCTIWWVNNALYLLSTYFIKYTFQ